MSKAQSTLLKKKRLRSNSSKYLENYMPKEFIIRKANSRYYFTLSIEEDMNRIAIRCGPSSASLKFEINLELELLKQKCRIFNACYNLEEAFKIISNLFKNKKVGIKEENPDSIVLVLTLLNYIEDKEEEVCLNLVKNKINVRGDLNELGNKKFRINIVKETKENKENNLDLDFDKKIITLFRNDQAKDNQLARLEKNLQEIQNLHYSIKKETNAIKRKIGFNNNATNQEIEQNKEQDDFEENEKEENKENEENEENELSEKEGQDEDEDEDEYQEKEVEKPFKNKESRKVQKGKAKGREKVKEKSSKLRIIKIKEVKGINKNDNKSKTIPQMSPCKILTKKALCKFLGDNNFAVFKTINKEILLAYATPYNSIHFYNIEIEKVVKRITNAHDVEITNFRYTYDKNNNRDLLLSLSNAVKNIKVWDVQKLNCIINIIEAYRLGDLFSSCFLIDENHKRNYIISINYDKENLKIFDFEGKQIREIDNSQDKSFLVDTFYNPKSKKFYIVVANEKFIVSYKFDDGTIYNKYCDKSSNSWHMNFIINSKEKEVDLIESDTIGYVRIWDFNRGIMLKKYFIERKMRLRGICLWTNKYLFIGAEDKKIKLIDLENDVEIDSLKCNDYVCTMKKINCSKFGECLIFQGKIDHGQIKLWRNENSK